MKLMKYVGPSDALTGRRFYVIDKPTVLGGVRARHEHADSDAWYIYDADDFEEIDQENT